MIQAGLRTLTKAESNYSILELEATAISWSVRKARFYLLAHPPFFRVMSDHRPLMYLFREPIGNMENPRLLRIREKVLGYSFKVIYKKGSEQYVADAFSRHAVDSPDVSDDEYACTQHFACTLTQSCRILGLHATKIQSMSSCAMHSYAANTCMNCQQRILRRHIRMNGTECPFQTASFALMHVDYSFPAASRTLSSQKPIRLPTKA